MRKAHKLTYHMYQVLLLLKLTIVSLVDHKYSCIYSLDRILGTDHNYTSPTHSSTRNMPILITDLPLDCLDMIFRELSPSELASVSRTCTLLKDRIEDYKQRFPEEYGKKMNETRRCVEDAPFNFEHDETDTEGDGNFLVDFDDDIDDFLEGEDDEWDEHSDLDSFGSNLAYESDDDDDDDWC